MNTPKEKDANTNDFSTFPSPLNETESLASTYAENVIPIKPAPKLNRKYFKAVSTVVPGIRITPRKVSNEVASNIGSKKFISTFRWFIELNSMVFHRLPGDITISKKILNIVFTSRF